MKKHTVIVALGITAMTAGLAVVILWEINVVWAFVPILLGAFALGCELLFYILSLTQRDSNNAKSDTSERKELP